jgi:hypothetical protein
LHGKTGLWPVFPGACSKTSRVLEQGIHPVYHIRSITQGKKTGRLSQGESITLSVKKGLSGEIFPDSPEQIYLPARFVPVKRQAGIWLQGNPASRSWR